MLGGGSRSGFRLLRMAELNKFSTEFTASSAGWNYFLLGSRRDAIAKNQNTFAKRQREMEKKYKADEKRKRRLERKLNAEAVPESEQAMGDDQPGAADDLEV
ncbi:hypothetical protein CA13_30740 [Planctomycetes bacterium CA13]|uniref:Uncharacterized protein n=1 Tax=Novipirellula herctigrandis TaxID=2527986 RepID=A0A5C5Z464_9BACT|nr:hypothetical protein CA13_30740 [Planctomycetes bacterium CA13]